MTEFATVVCLDGHDLDGPSASPASRWRRAFLPFVLTLVVAGCSNATTTGTTTPTASAGSSATSNPSAAPSRWPSGCHQNYGNKCAGLLAAGTYSSKLFEPQVTFEVPAGWANNKDADGLYILLPPSSKPGDPRDWIAFVANVMMPDVGCAPGDPVDMGDSAADIAERMAGRINLSTTSPQPATVGGLTGSVVDVRLADKATVECFPEPGVNLLHGLGPSSGYDQAIGDGTAMRIFLFDRGDDVLAIEIDDVSGGDRLDEFAAVLDTVQFSP